MDYSDLHNSQLVMAGATDNATIYTTIQGDSKFMLQPFFHTNIRNTEKRITQKYFHLGTSKMICKLYVSYNVLEGGLGVN